MTSTEPIPNEPTEVFSPLQTPSDDESIKLETETQTNISEPINLEAETQSAVDEPVNLETETQSNPDESAQLELETQIDPEETSGAIFQAVGIIVGEVNLTSEGKNTVTIGRSEYPLFYIPRKRRVFEALQKEIETTGKRTQRLVVYPRAIHFPKKEQPHQIVFQLVGFDKGREEEAVSGELKDLEFKFSGLWQFIPVCSTPCISVFRNFTRERLEYIKQAEPAQKVKFMKASHLPLLWKDAPVRPFRFNPKADFDQGHPAFVAIKAKFLPQRNVFGFVELLAPPQETAPRFLKASKKDKAAVQQTSRKDKPTVQQSPSKKDTPQQSPSKKDKDQVTVKPVSKAVIKKRKV